MSKTTYDLHLDGPGSPISIKKFLESDPEFSKQEGIKVLLDQTGGGFDKEDLPYMEINDEECFRNADWYSENAFDGQNIPVYILKWLAYFNEREIYEHTSDISDLQKFLDTDQGKEDHKYLCNLIKYCKKNLEARKLLGLITLWCGLLMESRFHKVPLKVVMQHPESHLHPKKNQKLMWWFETTIKEYYPESQKNDDTEL